MEPIAGMDKRKSKAASLYLKNGGNQEEGLEEERSQGEQDISISFSGPYFAQVPQDLIRDPEMPHAAVRIWALCHTYSPNKRFCMTFVSQTTLARNAGVHRDRITYWLRFLEKKGWLDIVRRGQGKTNKIILHGIRRRRN